MIALAITGRDFSETTIYMSDNCDEAAQMRQWLLNGSLGPVIRPGIKSVSLSHEQATEFWANQGRNDGKTNFPCPLVPKTFVRIYLRHFNTQG